MSVSLTDEELPHLVKGRQTYLLNHAKNNIFGLIMGADDVDIDFTSQMTGLNTIYAQNYNSVQTSGECVCTCVYTNI